MKFVLASLILFLGMYAFAEQDELEAQLEKSTCSIQDNQGQPIKESCDGFAQPQPPKTSKTLKNKISSKDSDEDFEIE